MMKFNEYYLLKEDLETIEEILLFESEVVQLLEWKKTHPGKGISEKKKSDVVKKARRGEKIFGGGFDKIEKSAAKRYGSEEAGKNVAAAVMWRKLKGKHMTSEEIDDYLWILEDNLKVISETFAHEAEILMMERKKKKWIQDAVNPKHKGWCTPLSNPKCTGHRRAFALRAKEHDL